MPRLIRGALLAGIALPAACMPYVVGNTAQPVPRGGRLVTTTIYLVPNGIALHDSMPETLRGIDPEYRIGISERADIGVRFPTMTGFVVNYKHRLLGDADPDSSALSFMIGGGVVGIGVHAQVEATLIGSAPMRGVFAPYGGLKFMHLEPLSRHTWHDPPTVGAFLGVRIGDSRDAIVPELALYYDEPTGGFRNVNVVFVPSVSIRGDFLERLFGPGWLW